MKSLFEAEIPLVIFGMKPAFLVEKKPVIRTGSSFRPKRYLCWLVGVSCYVHFQPNVVIGIRYRNCESLEYLKI